MLIHLDDWAENCEAKPKQMKSNNISQEGPVYRVGEFRMEKDTALSGGNLEDFQSLEAAHYPWNLKKSGKFDLKLSFTFTQTVLCAQLMAPGQVKGTTLTHS